MDKKSNSNDRQPTVEARKTKRYAGSKPLYKVLRLLFSLLGTYLIIYSLFFTGALRHVFSGGNGTFISSDEPHLLMHSARSVLRDYAEAAQLGDAEAIIYNDQKLQELEERLDEDVFLFARLNGSPEDKALLNEFYWLPAHAVLYSNGSIASGINHAYAVSGASQPPTAVAK